MSSFEFNTPSRILFGRGQIDRLADLGPPFGSSAILIHAGDNESWQVMRVAKLLEAKQIRLTLLRQSGEPKVEDVNAALLAAQRADCEFVVGLGGGSAIDVAKALAGLLGNGGSALDYLEVVGKGQRLTRPAAPWVAIPTTAGTGAEATRNAVLTAGTFKASMRSEHLLPKLAIVDPDLLLASKPEVIASSGMDALCQLIESYTSTGANPLTDDLALHGIQECAPVLAAAYEKPGRVELREPLAFAALLSGIALTNAGLGAVHGFAAPLGAHFPIPHGVICAALLPPVISTNFAALRAQQVDHPGLLRYAAIGKVIADDANLTPTQAIARLHSFTADLLRQLHIPALSNYGLREGDIPKMVELAKQSSSMKYKPVKLSDDALAGILRAGIAGYPDAK